MFAINKLSFINFICCLFLYYPVYRNNAGILVRGASLSSDNVGTAESDIGKRSSVGGGVSYGNGNIRESGKSESAGGPSIALPASEDDASDEEDRNCTCSTNSSCLCCIDLNLSFIDLGGPGCVKLNYMPQNDSINVDLSYGQKLLQSDNMRRNALEPTCMDLFSDLAQLCTGFKEFARVENGVRGCVVLEPVLLGISQGVYSVGCFNMDQPGVQDQQMLESSTKREYIAPEESLTKPANSSSSEEEDEQEIAAAISHSAEESIAWFSSLISSVFGSDAASNSTSPQSSPPDNRDGNKTNI